MTLLTVLRTVGGKIYSLASSPNGGLETIVSYKNVQAISNPLSKVLSHGKS